MLTSFTEHLAPFSRKTRSGRDFATWDGHHVTPTNQEFDFKALLQASVERDDLLDLNPDQAFEDYPETLTTSFPPDGPLRPPSPAPAPTPQARPPLDPSLTGKERRRVRAKAQSRQNRLHRRDVAAESTFSHHTVRPAVTQKYVGGDNACSTSMNAKAANVASTGYVGLDSRERSHRSYTLEEVVGPDSLFKFNLLKYKKGTPIPLVSEDGEKYIIGLVAGHPDDENWASLMADAAASLEDARKRCNVPQEDLVHRRGAFATLRCGVSHGGGQTQPSNLGNNKVNRQIVEELNGKEPFQRIAGFASSVLATWFPKLHDYCVDRLGALHGHYPTLRRNFVSSVFAASTYNLGPHTSCFKHLDFHNLPFGMCAVTALGTYDYTKGGHLILWDAHLVIEFPPGVTILLPSAIVTHSNTSIAPHERRYSFAQYSAGGLFRWVENGFQTSVQKKASLSPQERKQYDQRAQQRWAFGLSLLSRLSDVQKIVDTQSTAGR